jgi:hypothetical protein
MVHYESWPIVYSSLIIRALISILRRGPASLKAGTYIGKHKNRIKAEELVSIGIRNHEPTV